MSYTNNAKNKYVNNSYANRFNVSYERDCRLSDSEIGHDVKEEKR